MKNLKVNGSIKEGIIDSNSKEITVVFQNNTQNSYTYGVQFDLEIEKNGQWYKVPFKYDMQFILLGYILQGYKTSEEKIDLKLFYKLSNGKYRVVKEMFSDTDKFKVTAEFEVKS